MFEKVNPSHPDKIADRIAGAIVDLAYTKAPNPKVAVEVLIGHGVCHIINETSTKIQLSEINSIVKRIAGDVSVDYLETLQDQILSNNQANGFRCGDNGIFMGAPRTAEQDRLTMFAKSIYAEFPYDGKYILDDENKFTVCQSNMTDTEWSEFITDYCGNAFEFNVNPLGYWTGGTSVDTGATNRKLGSDMGDAVTGGGLHGKDLSKADVSVNIYAYLKAQALGKEVRLCCAIGDDTVDNLPYGLIVEIARNYIKSIGGFEKFAEWGLIRPIK